MSAACPCGSGRP
ncbi:MAG: hypothetical protein EPN99_06245 [Frankiales bacterium]|nr:MAG: hypothetical protein EPN99_06245 [Frankiales bacterium]